MQQVESEDLFQFQQYQGQLLDTVWVEMDQTNQNDTTLGTLLHTVFLFFFFLLLLALSR